MHIAMAHLLDLLSGFSITDALDIAIVSVLLYLCWSWFKQTKAAFVAIGMLILTGIYIVARILKLVLTAYIFQGFFAVFLLAIIIIFQEELRHFFERLAVISLGWHRAPPSVETEELVQTLGELAQERNGALIVLRGRDPIERHITEGYELAGKISKALLKSIFDPHSEGHDGAVVIGDQRVERFGSYLPLGKDLAQNARLGTRHAAALGLSELTDSLCLVVSEERGMISIAKNGKLTEIN
ncbi:MAG: diadenylate cyclase, partial [candidate division NC10 bacterium]